MFYGNDPRPGDTELIKAEKDEFVVNRNAARKYKPFLDFINYVDEPRFDNDNTAHSAIDEAIALNTLANMQKGGKVGLKPIPEGNKGLAKLPDTVRNRMGYMQEGGKVPKDPDPLQIDARMRGDFKDVGTIGIVDSLAYYKDLRDKAMRDKKMLEEGAFLEGYEPSMDRIEDDLMRALKFFEREYKSSPKSKKYQTGGSISYGSQTVGVPTLEELYQQAGITPTGLQKTQFESRFTYDPSAEETTVAGYMQGLEGSRAAGTGTLANVTSSAQVAGGGFAGAGIRGRGIEQARRSAQQAYESDIEKTQRGMFQDIKAQRDAFTSDALSALSTLESVGGTDAYRPPPPTVNALPTTNQGDVMFNGVKYIFYQGNYISESELDRIMEEEQDRSRDEDLYYD